MAIIDFDATASFNVLPTGTYNMKVSEMSQGFSKVGNPMITARLVVMDGEFEGEQYTDFLSLNDKALWKLARFVVACQVQKAKGKMDTESSEFKSIINSCIGQTLYIEVEEKDGRNGSLSYSADKDCEPVFLASDKLPEFLN